MKTIVLLAGNATRMRPLSDYMNKGMIFIEGKPLVEYVVEGLVAAGLNDLIFTVLKFPEQLEHYFGDGGEFGADIEYVRRAEAVGTAGEVDALSERIPADESFVVHYGDILTNFDIRGMVEEHLVDEAMATIGLVRGVSMHAGVAEVGADGEMVDFREKPRIEQPCHAAIDVFGPGVWDYVGAGMDFGYDVIPAMVEADEDVRAYIDDEAWWMDVGRLSDLDDAAELLRQRS